MQVTNLALCLPNIHRTARRFEAGSATKFAVWVFAMVADFPSESRNVKSAHDFDNSFSLCPGLKTSTGNEGFFKLLLKLRIVDAGKTQSAKFSALGRVKIKKTVPAAVMNPETQQLICENCRKPVGERNFALRNRRTREQLNCCSAFCRAAVRSSSGRGGRGDAGRKSL